MELHQISAGDRAALKSILASEGWKVINLLYDNYRLKLLADAVDSKELLPDGMAVIGYSMKYRAHGATEMLSLIANTAEGKDLDKEPKKS